MSTDAFDDVFSEMVNDDAVTAAQDTESDDEQGTAESETETTATAAEDDQVSETGDDETGNEGDADGDDGEGDDDSTVVPRKALLSEQKRRQKERDARLAMEEELARARAELDVLKGGGKAETEPGAESSDPLAELEKLDFFEDPDAYLKKMRGLLASAHERADMAEIRALARVSQAAARKKYDDFEDTMKVFSELREVDPTAQQKVLDSDDPAETAYKLAKQYAVAKNPEKAREAIEAELLNDEAFLEKMRAKLLGEDPPTNKGGKPRLPTNLAAQRSAGDPATRDTDDEGDFDQSEFERLMDGKAVSY